MSNYPSINALRAFEAVARHLSFTEAGQELHLTQAAVSYRIRTLEDQLGVNLFLRIKHGIELSPAGGAYLLIARDVLRRLERGAESLKRDRGSNKAPVRILATEAFASLWLVPRISRLIQTHPELDLRVLSWTGGNHRLVEEEFQRDSADLAVVLAESPVSFPGLVAEAIVRDRVVPVCSPALSGGQGHLSPQELDWSSQTLLHSITWPGSWQHWLTIAGVGPLHVSRAIFLQNTGLAVAAAMQGAGIAIAHGPLIGRQLQCQQLSIPFSTYCSSVRWFHVVYRRSMMRSPQFVFFKEWLVGELQSENLPYRANQSEDVHHPI